ncbi:MAG TPA: DUF1616 domain-containing protein [Ktedonobacteraceae bacterium]|nr:DUF1616 domain-containing protein [Ktedonobacteraceae bacterium]
MRLRSLDLFLALAIAVANVAWAVFTMSDNMASLSAVSVALALPLVFLIPGYLITETLFPHRALETVQRLTFSIALSISVAIFGGFLLDQLPTGLRLLPWVIWLGALTAVFALLAYVRRKNQPAPPHMQAQDQPRRGRVQISAFLLFGMAALVIVLSVLYSVVGAEQRTHPGYTNLWIVPAVESGNTCAVSVGMQSYELATTTYRVVVNTNRAQTASWSSVSLVPQQQWAQLEPIPVGGDTSLVVQVQLYRLDQPQTIYRHVDLTFHVASNGNVKQCSIS